ncbi:MAG: alpha-amylase family glycosyl hydrolase [Spirochaetia bacterium]|jgi:1,4-alpha-glucan branching enzyme|nr:alpha-amylase family glycosyl hydrolase [Spirochaetia bacterium]
MLKIFETDEYLKPWSGIIEKRYKKFLAVKKRITGGRLLTDYACGHLYYGVHKTDEGWVVREWAPNASEIYLISELSEWKKKASYRFHRIEGTDDWELACGSSMLNHGLLYKLQVIWPGGSGERIPAYAQRVVQDDETKIFSAQIWDPPEKYEWKHSFTSSGEAPLVYEAHVGMAQEEGKTGTFAEFEKNVLPIIKDSGYNTVQFMALMEHPYYGSFGYQVSNFFALSSRFGTPEGFKSLVDSCHEAGLRVIMDIVHSHAVKNENEGLSLFDGTDYQYFHSGPRGTHPAWDTRLFDYGKEKVLHFLLSNCAYWLSEYNMDGFRFDGVTSMLYADHGLGKSYTSYDDYFSGNSDEDAIIYISLANSLVHEMKPEAITVSEDMSGYPGMAFSTEEGGLGFDYRLAMGIPDFWIKIIKEKPDEQWSAGEIWHQLSNRRKAEKSIAYCESHDQALVGDKTIAFRLMDSLMYTSMGVQDQNVIVDRGIALHKIIRLLTFSIGGEGYLNFMGNEFGHPEWIDFPREGNNWSYHYARRQWSLVNDKNLRYHYLAAFDRALLKSCGKVLSDRHAENVRIDDAGQVLSYKRGNLLFAVNLSPAVSHTDYILNADAESYDLVLNSDSPAFNGFGRVPDMLRLHSFKEGGRSFITPYLPARCALVFRAAEE